VAGVHGRGVKGARLLRLGGAHTDLIGWVRPSSLVVFGWPLCKAPTAREPRYLSFPVRALYATHPPLTKATFVFNTTPIFPVCVVGLCSALGEIVLVFLAGDGGLGLDEQISLFLDEIEPCILGRREIRVRVTFVNAAAVNLETEGHVYHEARYLSRGREVCTTLKEYVDLVRRVRSLGDDRVRCLSLEEYELEVGTETFKLETDPSYALV
jgi:hypothetical protein